MRRADSFGPNLKPLKIIINFCPISQRLKLPASKLKKKEDASLCGVLCSLFHARLGNNFNNNLPFGRFRMPQCVCVFRRTIFFASAVVKINGI